MDSNPQPEQIIEPNNKFLEEAATPTIPAMQPGYTPPLPPNSPEQKQAPEQPAYEPPPDGGTPVFDGSEEEDPQEQEQPASAERSNDYKDKVILGLIKAEDNITSTICAMIAGQEDSSPFRATDQDIDDLRVTIEPFEDWIIDKCPAILPFLMVYGSMKIKQFNRGRKIYKTNKENREAADDGTMLRKVKELTDTDTTGRNNWTLYADGYYAKDRKGGYISNRADNRHLLEKPSVKDIDKILAVKANRNKELLAKAFGWTEADFAKHGIS